MIEIPVISEVYHFSESIDLDGQPYVLEFKFNDRTGLWTMNILNTDNEPIIYGFVLQTGTASYNQLKATPNSPQGFFAVLDLENMGRNPDFETFGISVKLYYVEVGELA